MGYLPSLGSKAAHLVTDITTVILNPISDELYKPPEEELGMTSPENSDAEKDTVEPDGPDTSSFTAFIVSFMSTESNGHSTKAENDYSAEKDKIASGSGIKEKSGRKGILARGKHSLGRAIHRAARLGGYRQNPEAKVDHDNTDDPKLVGLEMLPIKTLNENGTQFNLPGISEPSLLLSESMRGALYTSLPVLVKGRNWVLLYSTWRHGISLSTLYRRSSLWPGYSILVVGDKKGAVFGGLVEAPLQPINKRKYQGTNDCFVFTNISSHPVIYRSTGVNRYFTLCATEFLAMGGGKHFALYLDSDLLSGSSSASETFGNSCLAHSEDFEVKDIELWGFVYASKYDEVVDLCRTEKPGICRW